MSPTRDEGRGPRLQPASKNGLIAQVLSAVKAEQKAVLPLIEIPILRPPRRKSQSTTSPPRALFRALPKQSSIATPERHATRPRRRRPRTNPAICDSLASLADSSSSGEDNSKKSYTDPKPQYSLKPLCRRTKRRKKRMPSSPLIPSAVKKKQRLKPSKGTMIEIFPKSESKRASESKEANGNRPLKRKASSKASLSAASGCSKRQKITQSLANANDDDETLENDRKRKTVDGTTSNELRHDSDAKRSPPRPKRHLLQAASPDGLMQFALSSLRKTSAKESSTQERATRKKKQPSGNCKGDCVLHSPPPRMLQPASPDGLIHFALKHHRKAPRDATSTTAPVDQGKTPSSLQAGRRGQAHGKRGRATTRRTTHDVPQRGSKSSGQAKETEQTEEVVAVANRAEVSSQSLSAKEPDQANILQPRRKERAEESSLRAQSKEKNTRFRDNGRDRSGRSSTNLAPVVAARVYHGTASKKNEGLKASESASSRNKGANGAKLAADPPGTGDRVRARCASDDDETTTVSRAARVRPVPVSELGTAVDKGHCAEVSPWNEKPTGPINVIVGRRKRQTKCSSDSGAQGAMQSSSNSVSSSFKTRTKESSARGACFRIVKVPEAATLPATMPATSSEPFEGHEPLLPRCSGRHETSTSDRLHTRDDGFCLPHSDEDSDISGSSVRGEAWQPQQRRRPRVNFSALLQRRQKTDYQQEMDPAVDMLLGFLPVDASSTAEDDAADFKPPPPAAAINGDVGLDREAEDAASTQSTKLIGEPNGFGDLDMAVHDGRPGESTDFARGSSQGCAPPNGSCDRNDESSKGTPEEAEQASPDCGDGPVVTHRSSGETITPEQMLLSFFHVGEEHSDAYKERTPDSRGSDLQADEATIAEPQDIAGRGVELNAALHVSGAATTQPDQRNRGVDERIPSPVSQASTIFEQKYQTQLDARNCPDGNDRRLLLSTVRRLQKELGLGSRDERFYDDGSGNKPVRATTIRHITNVMRMDAARILEDYRNRDQNGGPTVWEVQQLLHRALEYVRKRLMSIPKLSLMYTAACDFEEKISYTNRIAEEKASKINSEVELLLAARDFFRRRLSDSQREDGERRKKLQETMDAATLLYCKADRFRFVPNNSEPSDHTW